ncbi:MAG: hypothetical protein OXI67_15575 [Candidatus Poribacteria bacterium]|nr:hypothetical protein [Candidatus Poribacteria bacterium]
MRKRKIRIRISDMFRQHWIKKVADVLTVGRYVLRAVVNLYYSKQSNHLDTSRIPTSSFTASKYKKGFEAVKKLLSLSLISVGVILIIILGMTGCSDMPYTGSMLQPGDVDKYLFSPGDGRICLTNGFETACLTLVPKRRDGTIPIIHIYPSSIKYIFYYKGVPILQAERPMDTSGIVEQIRDAGEDNQPRDGGIRSVDIPPPLPPPPVDPTPPDTGGGGQPSPGDTGGGNQQRDSQQPPGNTGGGSQQPGGQTHGNNGGGNNNNGGKNNDGQTSGDAGGSGQQPPGNTGGGSQQPPGGQTHGNNGGKNNDGQTSGDAGGSGQQPPGNTGGGTNPNPNFNPLPNQPLSNQQPPGGQQPPGSQTPDENGGENNNGDDNNGGENNNGGNNNDGQTPRENGGENNNNGGGQTPRDDQTPPSNNNPPVNNNPNPSGHNPPDNVDSHYVYGHENEDPTRNGWIIWVYYPHNYVAGGHPRNSINHPDGCGFTLSITGGTRTNFIQTSGPCTDNDSDNRDDYKDVPCTGGSNGVEGSDYSAQFFVREDNPTDEGLTEQEKKDKKITITVTWTHGMYAPQTQTFNIMKEVSMREYDANPPPYPGHTKQDGWD